MKGEKALCQGYQNELISITGYRANASTSPDGKKCGFWNGIFCSEYQTMDTVQKPSNIKHDIQAQN